MDTAKAVSAVHGTEAAAIPTTLAGSTFTPFHRLPEGVRAQMHRPSLAICEPAAMVPDDAPLLAATAMNALAHAIESLYAPLANPVTEEAALRSARLFADALPRDPAPAPDAGRGRVPGRLRRGERRPRRAPRRVPDHRPHLRDPARPDQRGDAPAQRPADEPARTG